LNSLVTHDGRRVFNAMAFIMTLLHKTDVEATLKRAQRWHTHPWTLCDGGRCEMKDRYAYTAVVKHEAALHNYESALDYMQHWVDTFWPLPATDVAVEEEADYVDNQDEQEDEHVEEELGAEGPPAYDEELHQDHAREPIRPASVELRSREDIEEVPAWVSFDSTSAKQWYKMLKDRGCDETCLMELFALAQCTDEARVQANAIIAKILKKEADKIPIHNISAFVHLCTTNTRDKLDLWLASYEPSDNKRSAKSDRSSPYRESGQWEDRSWSSSSWRGDEDWYRRW
jgi:hypothetical protein